MLNDEEKRALKLKAFEFACTLGIVNEKELIKAARKIYKELITVEPD